MARKAPQTDSPKRCHSIDTHFSYFFCCLPCYCEVAGSASVDSFNTPDNLVDLTVCLFVRMCLVGVKAKHALPTPTAKANGWSGPKTTRLSSRTAHSCGSSGSGFPNTRGAPGARGRGRSEVRGTQGKFPAGSQRGLYKFYGRHPRPAPRPSHGPTVNFLSLHI
ncbi:hypothetical protein EVAR_67735_1 [Eumeta japonica]|uniref:Uncharacterized protein n=1 Tax=Eumeta variegata TaxID=151549 RepID=A0A4C1ZCL8_EUMVA|nr:hypothetical protein EVAR_67735_1 [Eumeta japonica]